MRGKGRTKPSAKLGLLAGAFATYFLAWLTVQRTRVGEARNPPSGLVTTAIREPEDQHGASGRLVSRSRSYHMRHVLAVNCGVPNRINQRAWICFFFEIILSFTSLSSVKKLEGRTCSAAILNLSGLKSADDENR